MSLDFTPSCGSESLLSLGGSSRFDDALRTVGDDASFFWVGEKADTGEFREHSPIRQTDRVVPTAKFHHRHRCATPHSSRYPLVMKLIDLSYS